MVFLNAPSRAAKDLPPLCRGWRPASRRWRRRWAAARLAGKSLYVARTGKRNCEKKLKPTQPANSSVRPWKGGVPIYKVQFGGGANYLLATNTRTAPVHADRKVARVCILGCSYIYRVELIRRAKSSSSNPQYTHLSVDACVTNY